MVIKHRPDEQPFGHHCGMHGGWSPSVIGCKHAYTGKARAATIRLHFTNRRIACSECFDAWDELKYYCPACFTRQLEKYYPSIAQRITKEEWFARDAAPSMSAD